MELSREGWRHSGQTRDAGHRGTGDAEVVGQTHVQGACPPPLGLGLAWTSLSATQGAAGRSGHALPRDRSPGT